MAALAKAHLSFRVHPDDKREIEQTANRLGLRLTDYIVAACTGRLDSTVGLDAKLQRIDERLQRLEASEFSDSDTW